MDWSKDDYQRLGDKMRAARRELGYKTLKQFQDHLDEMDDKQLSGRTYADIEAGELRKRKRFSSESLAFLEDLFGWAPGVTRAILDGKNVDVWTGILTPEEGIYLPIKEWMPEDFEADDPVSGVAHALSERIDALEARVQQLEARYRPRRPLAAAPVRSTRKGGDEGDAGGTPATKGPGSGPDKPSSPAGLRALPTAASKTATEPSVNKRRRRQDEAVEASQDDGGMEPS